MPTTAAPLNLGVFIAVIAVLITWALFGLQIVNFRRSEQKRRRDDDEHLKEIISEVCEAFTKSDSYLLRRDKEMIAVAQNVTEEAFRIRASSFVDSGVYKTNRENDIERTARIEAAVLAVQKDFEQAAGKIAAEVTTQVAKLLRAPKN